MTHFRSCGRYLNGATSMRKTLWKVGLTTAAVVLCPSTSVYAQATANAGLNVTVNVASRARLTLGARGHHLRGRGPDATPRSDRGRAHGGRRRAHDAAAQRHADRARDGTFVGHQHDRHQQPDLDGKRRRLRAGRRTPRRRRTSAYLDRSGSANAARRPSRCRTAGVRARHLHDDPELHADRSLVHRRLENRHAGAEPRRFRSGRALRSTW